MMVGKMMEKEASQFTHMPAPKTYLIINPGAGSVSES